MSDERPHGDRALQRQIDDLLQRVSHLQDDVDDLRARADTANHRADTSEARAAAAQDRADASQARADAADRRADASEALSADDRRRIDDLEAHVDVDRAMILALQAEGLINHEQAVHLQQALRTSRRIGAAIGIIMAKYGSGEQDAFDLLIKASQHTNRKLRNLADDVVDAGDVTDLPGA